MNRKKIGQYLFMVGMAAIILETSVFKFFFWRKMFLLKNYEIKVSLLKNYEVLIFGLLIIFIIMIVVGFISMKRAEKLKT